MAMSVTQTRQPRPRRSPGGCRPGGHVILGTVDVGASPALAGAAPGRGRPGRAGFGLRAVLTGATKADESLVYYTVRRGHLPIVVTERGNLESQQTEQIICEVENFGGDRVGVTGTQIIFIVPNGSSVKKGDLLVELDSAPLKERLDAQYLALKRAEAEKIQATSKFENQKTQNETNLAEAELAVELAEDRRQFL